MAKIPDTFNERYKQVAYPPARSPARLAAPQSAMSALRRPLARSEKLMGIGTRLNVPLLAGTVSAGREVMYSSTHIGFPAWAGVTDWRAAMPWFYCNENPLGAPPEVDMANGGSVWASLGIAGVFTMGNFDGEAEGVMTAGTWGRWVKFGDPTYTPSGTGKIRAANVVALNGFRPVGLSRISSQSEASEWSSTLALTKIQTGGTITNNTTGYFYGPCLLIGKGNDGRMVPLILGNSIDFGKDETASLADSRGNMGFWQRGFDDAANRLPYGNLAVPGSRMGQQASLNAGEFQRRGQMLKSVETGVPFDLAVGGDENSALNDSIEWRRVIDAFADFINDTFGMPFAHRTMLPKVSYSGNKPGTDLAGQTAAVDQRLAVNTSLIATPGRAAATFQIGESLHDSGSTGKWKVPAFTTTVASAYAGSGAISLAASPPLGTALVFNDGISTVATCIVTAVTGAGPYSVTCVPVPPVQSLNAAVKASYTAGDGTHPTSDGHLNLAAPVVVTGKANFR